MAPTDRRPIATLGWTLWWLGGAGLWLGAIAAPLSALLLDVVTGPEPSAGWWLSSRQTALLGKTAALAGVSVVLTMLIAVWIVPSVGRLAERRGDSWLVLLLAVPLFLPPYVYAYGWDALVQPWWTKTAGTWAGPLRMVWVWSCWAWPIPTVILAGGWRRIGHAVYEAAILDGTSRTAFFRAVLPVLSAHAGLAAVVLWALFMIEYNVPHACTVQVYATELLAWAESSRHAVDVVAPAVHLLAVVAIALVVVVLLARGRATEDEQQQALPNEAGANSLRRSLPLLVVAGIAVVLPLVSLARQLESLDSFRMLWRVYHQAIGDTVTIAAGTGAAVVWLGLWLTHSGSTRRSLTRMLWCAAALTIGFGILPAALVGEAHILAYRRITWAYDGWAIMLLAQIARWGWVGCVAAWLVRRSTSRELIDQARTDGATRASAERGLGWRLHWPILASAALLATALTMAEVPAMSLVRPPGYGWMSLVLMEKFHRFEDQMLVTISLALACAPLPGLILGWTAWRWRRYD